jgi:SAM-dependent methyltransferase
MPDQGRPPVCDYEGSDYQTRFWLKGGREYEDLSEAVALRHLLPKQGRLLLELGAGAGRNTLRYTGFERIVLLDYSRTQLQQAQARLGGSERYLYVEADIYRLPFVDGLFDTATMIRTLHHMADAPAALAQVRKVLQPGAAFILEYANKCNLKSILRYALRRQTWNPFEREPVEFVPLNFDFHPRMVHDWLSGLHFQIERVRGVSYFRVDFLKRTLPARVLAGLDGLLQPSGELLPLSPSVFLRARAVGGPAAAPGGAFFKCPECGAWLLDLVENRLSCRVCSRGWAIREGIFDFREPAA